MGIPRMELLWNRLQTSARNGSISKDDLELYNKWGKALKHLAMDPRYPGLKSHTNSALTERFGKTIWQSYLENKRSKARRMFWAYGPDRQEITIVALDPHPESGKNGAYDRIELSDFPDRSTL